MIVLCTRNISEYEMEFVFYERTTKLVYEWRVQKNKGNQRGQSFTLLFGGATVTFLEGIFKQIPVKYHVNQYFIFFCYFFMGALVVIGLIRNHHAKRDRMVREGIYGREYDLDILLSLYARGGARRKFFLFLAILLGMCSFIFLMIGQGNGTIGPFIGAYGSGLGAYTLLIWDNPIARYRTVRNIRRQLKNCSCPLERDSRRRDQK